MKTRRKQRCEQALTETAAKVKLLDVDGKMVKELIFDDSSSDILDETSVGNKQDKTACLRFMFSIAYIMNTCAFI